VINQHFLNHHKIEHSSAREELVGIVLLIVDSKDEVGRADQLVLYKEGD
jgi:hypothetical protein